MGLIGYPRNGYSNTVSKASNIIEETTLPTQTLTNFKLNSACIQSDNQNFGGGTIAGGIVSGTLTLRLGNNFFITTKGIQVYIASYPATMQLDVKVNGQIIATERDIAGGNWTYLTDFANTSMLKTDNQSEITLEFTYTQVVHFFSNNLRLEIQGYWF